MATARKILDAPVVLTTSKSRDIEAQVRPLMLAIVEETTRNAGFVMRDPKWEELFLLVRRPVLSVLSHVFGIANLEDQDDMFQEVMLRFYRYHLSYDSNRPLLPWLYVIARHVKLDWKAKSRLRDESPSVERQSCDNLTHKLIAEEVLAKLPEDDRRILWLSYNEGLSDAEISAHLSIPLTTTKYYLRRAKKRARDFLCAYPGYGGKE